MAAAMQRYKENNQGRNLADTQHKIPVYWHIIQANETAGVWGNDLVEECMQDVRKAFGDTPFDFVLKGVDRTINERWFDCEQETYDLGK